ncbi:MAG: hypothetical protein RL653_1406 [Pseudomonadota bacterium]|jgi:hypothetical protein
MRPVLSLTAAAALCLAAEARADQCQSIPFDQATRAADLLRAAGRFATWCQPCNEAAPSAAQVVSRVTPRGTGGGRGVVQLNGRDVDLAYTWAWSERDRGFRNVAFLVGCPATGVSDFFVPGAPLPKAPPVAVSPQPSNLPVIPPNPNARPNLPVIPPNPNAQAVTPPPVPLAPPVPPAGIPGQAVPVQPPQPVQPVQAALTGDYRDCRELFVYALGADVPPLKPNRQTWDMGDGPDVQVLARLPSQPQQPPAILGATQADLARPRVAWNSPWPNEARGEWMKLRVGESFTVEVVDVDPMALEPMLGATLSVPQELARNGLGVLRLRQGAQGLDVAVSATDGRRWCGGLQTQPPPMNYSLGTSPVAAQLDAASWAELEAEFDCRANAASPGCDRSHYVANWSDLDGDGRVDLFAVAEQGRGAAWVGLWAGLPDARRRIYAGFCTPFSTAPNGEFTCVRAGGVDTVSTRPFVVRASAPVQPPPPPVAPPSPEQQKAALREEARAQLRALYDLQRHYFDDEESFTAELSELGFAPPAGNRYAYYAAMKGPGGARGRRQGNAVHPVDRDAFPGAKTPKTLKEAGCPITLGAKEDGEAVGLGLSASRTAWTGYAIGNLDTDGAYDCWSISTVERTARSGAVIPAGVPLLEKED